VAILSLCVGASHGRRYLVVFAFIPRSATNYIDFSIHDQNRALLTRVTIMIKTHVTKCSEAVVMVIVET